MKPSDELFRLIKSLSKSEKRFFKLSSSLQSGDKNYVKLFDAIEAQKEYDEEEIKHRFRKETFIRHLPSEKNHLYKLILKSLRAFHADSTVGGQLAEEIKNIEILYGRALYREAAKNIRRAKKLAYANEKFYYLFELIRLEKILLEEEYLSGNFDLDLDQLNREEQEVIEKLRNLAEYQILYSKINYVFRRGGYVRNDRERKMVEEVSDYHLIKGKNTAISHRAAATCHYIKGLCAIAENDYPRSQESFKRVVQIFEANPELIQDIPKQYIKSLDNLLYCFLDHGDFPAFRELIDKMRSLKNQPGFGAPDIQLKIFTTTYHAELRSLDLEAGFARTGKVVAETMDRLQKWQDKIAKEDEVLFWYNIARALFGAGQYKEALGWLNKVLNDNEPNLRQDVYSFARLFNLVIHFELGNHDLLAYLTKAALRFYQKRKRELNRAYAFELVFLEHFGRLARLQEKPEKVKEVFSELLPKVKAAFRHPYERVALEYFDFLTWIESKAKGEPYAELKKKKVEA